MQPQKILICDDDKLVFQSLKAALPSESLEWVTDCDQALARLKTSVPEVLFLDLNIRTPNEGLDYLPKFLAEFPQLTVIMLSGRTEYQTVRTALKTGAFDYLSKDATRQEIAIVVDKVARQRQLLKGRNQLNAEVKKNHSSNLLIGDSPAILALRKNIEKLQRSPVNVLVLGEPGTGKEIVSKQLRGTNAEGVLVPFVSIDSSTIHSSTAESILFGHEKGAFTGAEKTKRGLFEEADGGIIYFDEIGNMPLDIQAKLLRVIQEQEVLRLGATTPIKTSFRVIAATNKNLSEMVKKGEFRADLLDRLGVVTVSLPPLRERLADIPLLVSHFLSKQARNLKFTPETLKVFERYSWPGNIRELQNVISYVATMADEDSIEPSHLPPKFWEQGAAALPSSDGEESFYTSVKKFEAELLKREYANAKGNVSQLAKKLGMDRSHLHQKLKSYGI